MQLFDKLQPMSCIVAILTQFSTYQFTE